MERILMDQLESGASAIRATNQWFDRKDFSDFAREIRDVETVTSISLHSNLINDQMVAELAEALCHNRSVKELFLGDNLIGDEGARALGRMLARNKTLEILFLNQNRITDAGAVALLKGLQVNSTMKSLFMLSNPIIIDISLDKKLSLRENYCRMLALCALDHPDRNPKDLPPLPKDVLKLVRSMLANDWHEGVVQDSVARPPPSS